METYISKLSMALAAVIIISAALAQEVSAQEVSTQEVSAQTDLLIPTEESPAALIDPAADVAPAGLDVPVRKAPAEYDYEMRVGYAFIPYFQTLIFVFSGIWPDQGEKLGTNHLVGSFSLDFDMNLLKWLTVTVSARACGFHQNRYNEETGVKTGVFSGVCASLMPEVRFNWLNSGIVRMYSSLGVGAGMILTNNKNSNVNASAYFAFQVNPIGISVGGNVYGFLEGGLGTEYLGGKAGIGFRF